MAGLSFALGDTEKIRALAYKTRYSDIAYKVRDYGNILNALLTNNGQRYLFEFRGIYNKQPIDLVRQLLKEREILFRKFS